jgi:hypothetical protein
LAGEAPLSYRLKHGVKTMLAYAAWQRISPTDIRNTLSAQGFLLLFADTRAESLLSILAKQNDDLISSL